MHPLVDLAGVVDHRLEHSVRLGPGEVVDIHRLGYAADLPALQPVRISPVPGGARWYPLGGSIRAKKSVGETIHFAT